MPTEPGGPRVFLASRNAGKIAEMQRILSEHLPGLEVVGLDDAPAYDEPVEDAPTFVGNALLKARAGVRATGLATIADDSGLCVDALNEMPGVFSARWSGRPRDDDRNNRLLLDQLADVPDERRGAHFVCAVALVAADGDQLVVEGRMDGRIIREQRGCGGFGYDVVFVAAEHAHDGPEGAGLTTAEIGTGAKDRISHRGRALRDLAPRAAHLLVGGAGEGT